MKKILIIDDDADFLYVTSQQLEKEGFTVIQADTKSQGILLFKNENPDLIITDLMMENFDAGFELSYLAKKVNPDLPVIIVTNVTQEAGFNFNLSTEEEKNWIKADAILNKPIRFSQLLKEIQQRI